MEGLLYPLPALLHHIPPSLTPLSFRRQAEAKSLPRKGASVQPAKIQEPGNLEVKLLKTETPGAKIADAELV